MSSDAYKRNYNLIKWAPLPDRPAESHSRERKRATSYYFVPDITPFVSPMSRRVISSRKHLRDEERAYSVKQVGNDLKVPDYDNSERRQQVNERAIDAAFRRAAEKVWG